MTQELEKLEKRAYCFLQPPHVYEISGCDCGNSNTQWSEYEKHIWCEICKKDFIPKSNGIFDAPIMLHLCESLGIYFHKIDLQNNCIKAFSINSTKYIDMLVLSKKEKEYCVNCIAVDSSGNQEKTQLIINCMGYKINFCNEVPLSNDLWTVQIVAFNAASVDSWHLRLQVNNNKWEIKDNDANISFLNYLLKHTLLEQSIKTAKTKKI